MLSEYVEYNFENESMYVVLLIIDVINFNPSHLHKSSSIFSVRHSLIPIQFFLFSLSLSLFLTTK